MKSLIGLKNMILTLQRELGRQGPYTLKLGKGAAQQLVDEIGELESKSQELLLALEELFADYKALADSGDAGNWRIEDLPVGKRAMAVIADYRQSKQEQQQS